MGVEATPDHTRFPCDFAITKAMKALTVSLSMNLICPEAFVAGLFLGLMWCLHWLPLPVLGRIGNLLGLGLYAAASSRRQVALTNLRLCFPEWTPQRHEAVVREHFQAYARSMLERGILWWAPESRLRELIVVEPGMPLQAMQSGPTILLCPHFVSLDVAGAAVAMNISGCSVYARQSNPAFDRALRKGRERFRPTSLFPRCDGVKPIIRAMRAGQPFFMCPDMDFGIKDSEFVPFFGVPAATLTAPARIAAATGATVIPVIATVLPHYRGWRVEFQDPWDHYPGNDLTQATRRMNQFIEAQVRKAPSEYFWVHRRFKTRPAGLTGVYGANPHQAVASQRTSTPCET